MNVYKTRIFKYDDMWRVNYWLPYSGDLYVEFTTWERALEEAASIEKQRMWI